MFRYVILYRDTAIYVSKPYANKGAALTAGAWLSLKINEACLAADMGPRYVGLDVEPC